ncbi:uncharacterized protein LOC122510530 [Leptopilina heterotoma]|uniref:uncharacterized protein LOC122510530 n=1 Tax=Leptopilina heterotoma TaxID=63436 RepID=UPI001CA7C394|nr:uncharacterized protein LOC122510530 [Leptopilina heterotoma]
MIVLCKISDRVNCSVLRKRIDLCDKPTLKKHQRNITFYSVTASRSIYKYISQLLEKFSIFNYDFMFNIFYHREAYYDHNKGGVNIRLDNSSSRVLRKETTGKIYKCNKLTKKSHRVT